MSRRMGIKVLLLFTLMLFGVLGGTIGFAATETVDGITWTYDDSSGTESFIMECDVAVSRDVTVPATLGGLPVTGIGDDIFKLKPVKAVTLPATVLFIGEGAFESSSVTSVVLPEGITQIPSRAFKMCSGLTSVQLPSTLQFINPEAFAWASKLDNLVIPSTVVYIDETALERTNKLLHLTVDPSNTAYTAVDGVLFSADMTTLYMYPNTKAGPYVVPASVTTITGAGFNHNGQLTAITLPPNLVELSGVGFRDCWQLTSVEFPATFTAFLSENCFRGCSMLNSVTFAGPVTSIPAYAFYNCTELSTIQIPASVTDIGTYAFYWCSRFNGVPDLSSIVNIGDYAFENCRGFDSVTIPNTITSMGIGAFKGCVSLETVALPPTLLNIPESAFENTGIRTMVIPEGVSSIGPAAFYYCANLTDITIPASVTSVGAAFRGADGLTNVTFTPGPDILYLDNDAFANSGIQNIVLPDRIRVIYSGTFKQCYNLVTVTIPASVTQIRNGAFFECFALQRVRIPASVTSVEAFSFGSCTGLTKITFDSPTTVIAAHTETINSSASIYGAAGSTAQEYAINQSRAFFIAGADDFVSTFVKGVALGSTKLQSASVIPTNRFEYRIVNVMPVTPQTGDALPAGTQVLNIGDEFLADIGQLVCIYAVDASDKIEAYSYTYVEAAAQQSMRGFIGGTGTELDPYTLDSIDGLDGLRGTDGFISFGKFFKLTGNIDMNIAPYNQGAGWEPIEGFEGTLDGAGHKISGLYINRAEAKVGLFRTLESGAVVKKLGVINAAVRGNNAVGILSGTIHPGSAHEIFTTGSVIGTGSAGGIAGEMGSALDSIDNCYSRASVTSPLAGGLVGGIDGSAIRNSYYAGHLTQDSNSLKPADNFWEVGDIVLSTTVVHGPNILQSSFYNKELTQELSSTPEGTGIGYVQHGTGIASTEMRNQATFTGWDFAGIWDINPAYNDGFPYLRATYDGAAPVASNVQATQTDVNTLTVTWSYADADGDLAGLTTFQWKSCATSGGEFGDIAGATASTYTRKAGDQVLFFKCEVTVRALTGVLVGEPVRSNPAIQFATAPTATNVRITGQPQINRVITASYDLVAPVGTGASTYQWNMSSTVNGVYTPLVGSVDANLTLLPAWLNKFVTVTVTPKITSPDMIGTSVTSSPKKIGPQGPAAPEALNVQITGDNKVGDILTVSYSFVDANNAAETGTLIKWYISSTENGVYTEIAGEHGITYTIREGDVGKYIKASVTPGSQL